MPATVASVLRAYRLVVISGAIVIIILLAVFAASVLFDPPATNEKLAVLDVFANMSVGVMLGLLTLATLMKE